MLQSLVKTLAGKLKVRATAVYRRYGKKPGISVTTKQGRVIEFGRTSLARSKFWDKIDDEAILWVYYGRNELVERLQRDVCEIPGCGQNAVEGHHINQLKNLKQKYRKKGKEMPQWVEEMIGRQRKSLMVCKFHHQEIHGGRYDGPSLKGLANRRAE
jgi:hypothetical protein